MLNLTFWNCISCNYHLKRIFWPLSSFSSSIVFSCPCINNSIWSMTTATENAVRSGDERQVYRQTFQTDKITSLWQPAMETVTVLDRNGPISCRPQHFHCYYYCYYYYYYYYMEFNVPFPLYFQCYCVCNLMTLKDCHELHCLQRKFSASLKSIRLFVTDLRCFCC